MSERIVRVLFLCTGNSARSILAEALLNRLGVGRFSAESAGSHPTGALHPLAIEELREHGHPVEGLRSKGFETFATAEAAPIDLVITVCNDAAAEVCPVWPGAPPTVHWWLADPAAATGPIEARRNAFRRTYRKLERRIGELVKLDAVSLDPESLRAAVAAIASSEAGDGG